MLGERDEQVEELKSDLAEMKQLYRTHVNDLVLQIEQAKKSTR